MKCVVLVLVVVGFGVQSSLAGSPSPDLGLNVRSILSRNCFSCHGPDESRRQGELRLDLGDSAIAHGAIVPGSPEKSEVVRRITSDDGDLRMPPVDSGHHLTDAEVDAIQKWIAAGAHLPRHWSYEPPQRPERPKVANSQWCRNDIDFLVLARMEKEGLAPEPEADRYHLIRRLSLDLIGLPPTPQESEAFARDTNSDAYERVVDRLLESPAYGENWARKWLDLARYADTNGYESDRRRTMWPFRDWVINAFNSDMPFDEFTIEQLAGDLLPKPTKEQLIATAFHRNTMQNDEGGTDDEEYRVLAVIDRLNTTMQVWMGTTVGCCQCHSHKYDPISHREYYQLFAFFNQSADADRSDQEPTLVSALLKSSPNPQSDAAKPAAEVDKIPIMQELPRQQRRITRIFTRGNFLDPGEEVEARTPAAFATFPADAPHNRLGFAKWLVDRKNPLTARVVANRQWEQLFGDGLVLTSEDFGSQGMLPSNPQLLDWLAVELMDHKWSLKSLTKAIVMSATYRQSARTTAEKQRVDPENRWLARGPRTRLSAEQIRDQALAVSGLLSHKIGGPSVMPPQPEGVWQMVYNDDHWQTSEGEDRYRRGLYTFWRRTSPYPSAMSLDATSRETCTIRRVTTNTPVAAFALLNDPVYVEAAQALARRIMDHDRRDAAARVEYAIRQVLARPADADEIARIVTLFESENLHYRQDIGAAKKMATSELGPADPKYDLAELAAWAVVSNVLLNLDETLEK